VRVFPSPGSLPAPPLTGAALVALLAVAGAGCTHVDVKGREVLRLGPLRGVTVAAASVDRGAVDIDAGTDALTDEELAAIAEALPAALEASFERRAGERQARRLGRARIEGCRLRAGPGRTATVYVARCRVRIDVDDVTVLAVQAEALRRTPVRPISEEEAEVIKKLERNPLLSADDGRLALEAALDAAALLVVDGALPPREDGPPQPAPVPRETKAALARARVARVLEAEAPRPPSANPHAALFDLRSAGVPKDAERVLPFLEDEDPAVRAAAVDALGELCAPAMAARIEALAAAEDDDERVRLAAVRALPRLRACGKLDGR
jgi:hypothetical protein